MAIDSPPAPGTVYTFPLANGMHGACRVLRGPGADEAHRAGHTLVCATKWFGEPAAALKHPDTKKTAKSRRGAALCWLAGAPPSTFTLAGVLPVPKGDLTKKSNTVAPWEFLPNLALAAWKEQEDPTGFAEELRTNVQQGIEDTKAAARALAEREKIDLTGFVDLPKPRAEREPADVLRGFIAAMHQWERECARIQEKEGGGLVVHVNQPSLAVIFDEFCTPRTRPYGRQGMFTIPPEHDPHDEVGEVQPIDPRRVEIETVRPAPRAEQVRYVLLKVGGIWLVDSKTRNGLKATL